MLGTRLLRGLASFPPRPRSFAASSTTPLPVPIPSAPQSFLPSEVIKMKREGKSLGSAEINWFVSEYHQDSGTVMDYQMSAFLMAVCTKGMNEREAMDLTKALIQTGSQCVLRDALCNPESRKIVDKHSTGGVGDKVSLIVAPLAASLGLIVPMVCSRGLGHTGGTIDKLESIPGLTTQCTTEQFRHQLNAVGCAIVSPTLIASSIMSKKLANQPDSLLLDVKMGRGALMPKLNDAVSLARLMVAIGENAGVPTRALITNMEQPLGSAVGNFLEVCEAVQVLSSKGVEEGPHPMLETKDLALSMVAILLCMANKAHSYSHAYQLAEDKLHSGEALKKFLAMVSAQGGDTTIFSDLPGHVLEHTHSSQVVRAVRDGRIQQIDSVKIGMASLALGSGRLHAGDPIDPYAGLRLHVKVGDLVKEGDALFTASVGKREVQGLSPTARLEFGSRRGSDAFKLCPASTHAFPGSLIAFIVDNHDICVFDSGKADLIKHFTV
ncbi:hypothetical protein BASA81_000036 [Batrachochytrium salamandrivorans]|nr:hypothetical protein BASA81_000036 [Batrachochytrium salamandrivorans]